MSYLGIKDLIPKEKVKELLAKLEELKEKRNKLLKEMREVETTIRDLERLLIVIGAIEKKKEPVAIRGEKISAVVDYIMGLGSGKEFKFGEIIEATGATRGTVYQAVQKLLAEGKVEKIGKGVYKVKEG